jgi:hypothetical protein
MFKQGIKLFNGSMRIWITLDLKNVIDFRQKLQAHYVWYLHFHLDQIKDFLELDLVERNGISAPQITTNMFHLS